MGGTQKGDELQKLPLLFQCLYKVPEVFDHLQGKKVERKWKDQGGEKQAEEEEKEREDPLVRTSPSYIGNY